MTMRFRYAAVAATLLMSGAASPQSVQSSNALPVDCMPGPWTVYFGRNAAGLDAEDRAILDRALEEKLGACGSGWTFQLTGRADRGERRGVDRQRLEAVRTYFRQNGVTRERIGEQATGSGPRLRRHGAVEPHNQRVEITSTPVGVHS